MLDIQDKEVLKLIKLCKHWANHNNSHKESFLKWKNIALNKGIESVAEKLTYAIKMLDKCNEYLMSAYNEMEGISP
jgi:hypothetical protein